MRNLNKSSLLIFSIALFLRFIALFLFKSWMVADTGEYGQIANNILMGKGFSFDFYGLREDYPFRSFMPPLYPYIMASLLSCVYNPYLLLLLIQAVVSSLTALNIYYIGSSLFDQKVGLIAGLGVAIYPVFIVSAISSFYPLTIDIFLLSLALIFIIKANTTRNFSYSYTAGIAIGILALSLPQILAFFPFIILWLFINKTVNIKKKCIIIVTMAMLTISPWIVRNYFIHGHVVPIATNGGFNFWFGNNPFMTGIGWSIDEDAFRRYKGDCLIDNSIFAPATLEMKLNPDKYKPILKKKLISYLPNGVAEKIQKLPEAQSDSLLFKAGLSYISEEPIAYVKRCTKKIFNLWVYRPTEDRNDNFTNGIFNILYTIYYIFLTPLVLGGIIVSFSQDWRKPSLLYFVMFFFTLVYMNFFILSRYRWLFEPYMIVAASFFCAFLWRKYSKKYTESFKKIKKSLF